MPPGLIYVKGLQQGAYIWCNKEFEFEFSFQISVMLLRVDSMYINFESVWLNSLRPGDAYMRR